MGSKSLSSFKEARLIVLNNILRNSPTDSLRVFTDLDPFILTHLEFIEWTYWATELKGNPPSPKKGATVEEVEIGRKEHERMQARHLRSFVFLGNRNEILHGVQPSSRRDVINKKMVLNAVTLYVATAKVAKFIAGLLEGSGKRLSPSDGITLLEVRQMRRRAAMMCKTLGMMLVGAHRNEVGADQNRNATESR
jgi:hypothetical protein